MKLCSNSNVSKSLFKVFTRSFSTTASPQVSRDPRFSKLTNDDVDFFKKVLSAGVITQESDLQTYNTDWIKRFKGESKLALRPKSTDEVSKILQYCNNRKLAVVPQGGNTGLVGGSVPVFDEIVVSLGLLNSIESFDHNSGVVVVQAGVVLENLDKWLEQYGYTVPLDLGAKGSCQIGGNVSTNAGGVRLLRYGSLHANVLGLEVVLPDGTIVDSISTLRKDNTGYSLKNLFIGAEGTLGIVTKVALLTPPRPKSVSVCFLGCKDFESVKLTLSRAKSELGEVLSAFEFLDGQSLELVLRHISGATDPLENKHKCYILIETSGSNETHDQEKLTAFLESILEEGVVEDGVLAQDRTQVTSIWKLRESIPEALQKTGSVYKYDLSLPLSHFYQIVEDTRKRVGEKEIVTGHGHVGDGNVHLNVITPKYSEEVQNKIEPFVYEFTSQHKGSISAEHGLGLMKASHINYSKSEHAIDLMRKLKATIDPNNILNPYKVFTK